MQVAAIPHTLTASPSNDYLALDLTANDVKVQPGDIIAYRSTGGGILKSFASSAQDSDVKTINFNSAASAVALSSPKRHLLRAVVSQGSEVKVPFTFTTVGTKTVGISLNNSNLAVSVSSSKTITVIEGVDACVPNIVQYAEVGSAIQCQVLPHTGEKRYRVQEALCTAHLMDFINRLVFVKYVYRYR
jgi:hypothetical protein